MWLSLGARISVLQAQCVLSPHKWAQWTAKHVSNSKIRMYLYMERRVYLTNNECKPFFSFFFSYLNQTILKRRPIQSIHSQFSIECRRHHISKFPFNKSVLVFISWIYRFIYSTNSCVCVCVRQWTKVLKKN